MGGAVVEDWLTMEFNRDARVCILVHSDTYKYGDTVKIDGWEMIGLVEWSPGKDKVMLGSLKADYRGNPMSWGFVGCKDVEKGKMTVPHADLLEGSHKITGYSILFGEKDGKGSKEPSVPDGWEKIKSNEKCPEDLHDLWVVEVDDGDKSVEGVKWKSWHPQIDPIYWCYYGHEHGSDPGMAGYKARFHYTAYKNGKQDEPHLHFKGYVVPAGDSLMYFNVHAETSSVRRINEPFHSVVIAATDKKSGELQMELSCKGNFGFSFTPLKKEYIPAFPAAPALGLGEKNTELMDEAFDKQWTLSKKRINKRINVVNVDKLDKRLIYETDVCNGCDQTDAVRMMGRYETWRSAGPQLCMTGSEKGLAEGLTIDIKDPGTACRSAGKCSSQDDLVELGVEADERITIFQTGLGIIRDIIFEKTTIGEDECGVEIPKRGDDYVFYTDPYCKEIVDGPGENAVRQVMKPGFKASLDGGFGVNDPWARGTYSKNRDCVLGCEEDETFSGFQDMEGAIEKENA